LKTEKNLEKRRIFIYNQKKRCFMLRTILFKSLLGVFFIIYSPILLISLISRKSTWMVVIPGVLVILWMARVIVGIRYEIVDTVPGRNGKINPRSIMAVKHMSILESAILITNYPNLFFIIKRELMMIPIYGWAFWRMGLVSVNRKKGTTNMKALSVRATAEIEKGRTLVIYPEGTRAKPGAGVKIKKGLLFIAEESKTPIQPVGADTGIYWPKRGKMRAGTAKIWLEPPLSFNATLDEVAEAIARHSA